MSEESNLFRLTYVSAHDFRTDADGLHPAFAAIEAVAVKRNVATGITGFLICGGTWFAQIVEGSAESIDALFGKLQRDPRHRDLRVAERVEIPRRRFPDWAMALGYASPTTSMVFAVLDFSPIIVPDESYDDRLLDLATDLAAIKRVTT